VQQEESKDAKVWKREKEFQEKIKDLGSGKAIDIDKLRECVHEEVFAMFDLAQIRKERRPLLLDGNLQEYIRKIKQTQAAAEEIEAAIIKCAAESLSLNEE